MTKNLDSDGLSSIAHKYDLFYIDLWGVVHNGIKLYEGAISTLDELKKNSKDFVLLTNAPRPSASVIGFLDNLGITNKFYDSVVTSGDTTKISLQTGEFGYNIYHIGPKRDLCFFDQEPTLVSRSNKNPLSNFLNHSIFFFYY